MMSFNFITKPSFKVPNHRPKSSVFLTQNFSPNYIIGHIKSIGTYKNICSFMCLFLCLTAILHHFYTVTQIFRQIVTHSFIIHPPPNTNLPLVHHPLKFPFPNKIQLPQNCRLSSTTSPPQTEQTPDTHIYIFP